MLPKNDEYVDAIKNFRNTIDKMIIGMEEFNNLKSPKVTLIKKSDAKKLSQKISKKVDLIITSPPYCFAVDFNRYYRLSYYWFGWDVNRNRDFEIGARSKRGKKSGIDDYFSDLEQCIREFSKTLKKGGYCCFTLGDTRRRNEDIKTIDNVISFCEANGLVLSMHKYRNISRQSMAQKRIPTESVLIMQKK